MLTMAIPDVEISAVQLIAQYASNLFARWHQRLWFEKWGV